MTINEICLRSFIDERFWNDYGKELLSIYRVLINAIDIVRTSLCVIPILNRFLPEYKATQRLKKIIDEAVARHEKENCYPFVEMIKNMELYGKPLEYQDMKWMIMYQMWNATGYGGSYIYWAFLDILNHENVLHHIQNLEENRKEQAKFLELCFSETIRLHPITSLLRYAAKDFYYEEKGKKYFIPKGSFIVAYQHAINRDEKQFKNPDEYNPMRYLEGEQLPNLFGMGAFGCVAQYFVRSLAHIAMSHWVNNYEFEVQSSMPERKARVHLTYTDNAMYVVPTAKINAKKTNLEEVSAYLENSAPHLKEGGDISKCPFHRLLGLSPKRALAHKD